MSSLPCVFSTDETGTFKMSKIRIFQKMVRIWSKLIIIRTLYIIFYSHNLINETVIRGILQKTTLCTAGPPWVLFQNRCVTVSLNCFVFTNLRKVRCFHR